MFCQITLSDHTKQANITFTDIYIFDIDKSGSVINMRPSRAKYTDVLDVHTCLEKWRFSGFPDHTVFHVEFTWKHAVGWTQMRISGKDFSQTTILRREDSSD